VDRNHWVSIISATSPPHSHHPTYVEHSSYQRVRPNAPTREGEHNLLDEWTEEMKRFAKSLPIQLPDKIQVEKLFLEAEAREIAECDENVISTERDTEETLPPSKRLRTAVDDAPPKSRKARLRDSKKEAQWKSQGHLPRASTQRKYIGGALGVPTAFKVDSRPIKAGGYTALSKGTASGLDPQTVEQAIALGLTLVPYIES
jgi:hypothetical protein